MASPVDPKNEVGLRPVLAHCVIGDTLCRVQFWTEQEWDQLDSGKRPNTAEHLPGRGWIAAVPIGSMKKDEFAT